MNILGGFKALFVVGTALAAVSCSPGQEEQPAAPQEKHFDVTGWGKLKPGMSKQDALATGDLAATGAGKTGNCEDYRYEDGPAADPKQVAEDDALEQKIAEAQKAADAAKAAIGPEPGPNAGAADYAASAERLAASAEASNKVVQLTVESTKRIADRAEAREAHGGVLFAGDKIRMILPPPGATAAKDLGKGATVEQVKAAYPNATSAGDGMFDVPVPGQKGFVLSFHFAEGKLTAFMLFNTEAACA
ncbi:hypothetical protein [Lentzea albida]|uniref:Lipoprotein n=1 Tax=Lentzea albida TaxID=65499 RepID=A0A1H9BX76_9PSEU|nr:hypothetical protein [Lentzea albida]SEP92978.1 hypothetical protein SAMN04488000_101703 [Lentzea albida]